MSHYNVELIKSVINKFKNEVSLDDLEIYFDADNTLYRFSTYGQIEQALGLCYTKGFYKELPIFSEAPAVIENLQRIGIKVGIISTYIDTPFCYPEKMQSINYHFPTIPNDMIHLVPTGVKKSSIFDSLSNKLLVDDYHNNITDWYENGGVGIKKSYTGKARPVPVVCSLIDIFSVLHELEVL